MTFNAAVHVLTVLGAVATIVVSKASHSEAECDFTVSITSHKCESEGEVTQWKQIFADYDVIYMIV